MDCNRRLLYYVKLRNKLDHAMGITISFCFHTGPERVLGVHPVLNL